MSRDLWIYAVVASTVALLLAGCETGVREDPGPSGAGEDAGHLTDAGEDAGSDTDAGAIDAGPLDAGPDCTGSNLHCTGPFRCNPDPDGGTGVCEALWIGLTQSVAGADGGTLSLATLVRFNDDGSSVTLGGPGEATREPRFSGDGSRVAFIAEPGVSGAGEPQLRQSGLPLDGGFEVLATAADTGGVNFLQLDYAPANAVAWTRVIGETNSREGIQFVPGTGGAITQVSITGTQPNWSPAEDRLAFTNAGVKVYLRSDGTVVGVTSDPNDEQPQFSPGGDWILFQRLAPNVADPNHPFMRDLMVVPAAGGAPVLIEAYRLPTGTAANGGSPGTFVQFPIWGPTNGQIVYVRFNWFFDALGNATACEPTHPICGGLFSQQIVVAPFDPGAGTAGAPVIFGPGTQPSVSPDGTHLAYITGNGQGDLVLRIAPINPDGSAVEEGTEFEHLFPGIVTTGPESRPRWQPRQ
jgi:WD40-like Beta Propeller Repeat